MSTKRETQAEVNRQKWRRMSARKSDWLKTEVRSLVQSNKDRRITLLLQLYQRTGGNEECPISLRFLRTSRQKLRGVLNVALHLERKGLVMIQKEIKLADCRVGLTLKGVNAVENMYTDRKPPNPRVVVVEGDGGFVQIGSNNSATITQNFGFDADQVLRLLSELRNDVEKLPSTDRRQVSDIVDALDQEAQSVPLDKSKIKALISQLGYFAIKSSAESVIPRIIQLLVQAVNA